MFFWTGVLPRGVMSSIKLIRCANRTVFQLLLVAAVLSLLACSGEKNEVTEADSGLVVGLVTNNPNGMKNVEGFRQAMAALGYVEGKNIEYR